MTTSGTTYWHEVLGAHHHAGHTSNPPGWICECGELLPSDGRTKRDVLIDHQAAALNDALKNPLRDLLTPAEVACIFSVDPKTVTRWAQAGKLASIRTLGGHRRFPRAAVIGHLAVKDA
jgi:excisionase family DNA binding protein